MARLSPTLTRLAKKLGAQVLEQATSRRSAKGGPTNGATGRRIPKPPTSGRGKASPASTSAKSTAQAKAKPVTPPPGFGAGATHGDDARREVAPTPQARLHVEYAPSRDGDADPGEIVWTWVPYEEDASQGKDRPVLVVGRWGEDVAALALTSKAHDDRHHHAVGVWDTNDGRESWLKLDRILRLDPDGIRREGAVLDLDRFRTAIKAWEQYQ